MSPADSSHSPDDDLAAKERFCSFDLSGWTLLRLTGRDAVKFLHNFCTNDIQRLSPGAGCEAFITNVKARVLGHVFAYRDDPTTLTLLASPGQGTTLVPHFDRYVITEDVAIADLTNESDLQLLTGPQLADADTARNLFGPPTGPSETIRRVDLLGQPGWLLERSRKAAANSPGSNVVRPGDRSAFESLRIGACFPYYGVDVTEDQLAPEVGRPWAISYTKGCYLGQEPIARIDALGHVNKLLRGLRLESGPVPERGATIIADDKEIGSVKSATTSHADGRPIALGFLRSKFAEPGTNVVVRTEGSEVPATVFGPVDESGGTP
ncbi:MAG: glycine cleavage T C-terminal barrel domain-containing protein [Planctomycetaceae bacterium]